MSTTKGVKEIVETNVSRRGFMGLGVFAGGALTLGALMGADAKEAQAKTYDSIDDMIEINPDEFERYDGYRVAFYHGNAYREGVTPPWPVGPQEGDDELWIRAELGDVTKSFEDGDPGYTQIDKAFFMGGQGTQLATLSNHTAGTDSWDSSIHLQQPDGRWVAQGLYGQETASFLGAYPGSFDVAEEKWEFASPADASYAVKKAAKVYGADLVGIAPYDERFIFKSEMFQPIGTDELQTDWERPIEFDFDCKSVVVLIHEMDYQAMKTAGGQAEVGATMMGYARMATQSQRTATFLRHLGYHTYHCGNNVSPSVAEAIRAGLGEGGRNSILITKEFGPRVRISKVYTDLECEYDKPTSFGVTEFCEVCQVCTDNCPSGAISSMSINDPENKPVNRCSQAGVKKYYLNAQKCYYQWNVMGPNYGPNDCGICITVCPYNKPQTWNHDLVKVVTLVPGLNRLARYFDHFFGFGHLATKDELVDFWVRDI